MPDEQYPSHGEVHNGWGVLSRHEYDVLGELPLVLRSIATALPVGFAAGYLRAVAAELDEDVAEVLERFLADGLVSELGTAGVSA